MNTEMTLVYIIALDHFNYVAKYVSMYKTKVNHRLDKIVKYTILVRRIYIYL